MSGEISKPSVAKYWVAYSANAIHYGVNEPDQVTTSGQTTFQYFDDEQGQLKSLSSVQNRVPTLPSMGEQVNAGDIYRDGAILVKARQTHLRTEHPTADIPALFSVVRQPNTNMQWIKGEQVYKGDVRTYNSVNYSCIQAHQTEFTPDLVPALWVVATTATAGEWIPREEVTVNAVRTYKSTSYTCLQAHTTQLGWEPTATLGVLWRLTVSTTEWAPGQAVKIGDIRTYQGKSYSCRQAHTTQVGWQPPVVPALWSLI